MNKSLINSTLDKNKTVDSSIITNGENVKTNSKRNSKSLGIPKLRLKKVKNSSDFTVANELSVENRMQIHTTEHKLKKIEIRVKKLSPEEIESLILASTVNSTNAVKPINDEINKPPERKQIKIVKKTLPVKTNCRNSVSDTYISQRQVDKTLKLDTKKSDSQLINTKSTVREKPNETVSVPKRESYNIVDSIMKGMDATSFRIPKKKRSKTPEQCVTSTPVKEPLVATQTRYFNRDMFAYFEAENAGSNFLNTSSKITNTNRNVITGPLSEPTRMVSNGNKMLVDAEESLCETKFSRRSRKRRIESDSSEDDDDFFVTKSKLTNLSDDECDEDTHQLTEKESVPVPEVPEIASVMTRESDKSFQKDTNLELSYLDCNIIKVDAHNHVNGVEDSDVELSDSDDGLSICISDSFLCPATPQEKQEIMEEEDQEIIQTHKETDQIEGVQEDVDNSKSLIQEIPKYDVKRLIIANTSNTTGDTSINNNVPTEPKPKPLFPPLIKKTTRKQDPFEVHSSDDDFSGNVMFNQICKDLLQMTAENEQQVRTSVEVLTNPQLEELYENYICKCKHPKLFIVGFPVVALELGARKMKNLLMKAIHECEKHKMLAYWKYVIDGLEKSGMDRKEALITLIRVHKNRTFSAIDVILELIAFSSFAIVAQMMPNLMKFIKTPGYLMKENVVERMLYLLNVNGYPEVLHFMLTVLKCGLIQVVPRGETTELFTTRLSFVIEMLTNWATDN